MRTTLTIDDDVLAAVSERARRERRTAGEVASELIREALTRREPTTSVRNGFPQLPSRGVIVTNELINAIRQDIGE